MRMLEALCVYVTVRLMRVVYVSVRQMRMLEPLCVYVTVRLMRVVYVSVRQMRVQERCRSLSPCRWCRA
jgi:hypothetical protein